MNASSFRTWRLWTRATLQVPGGSVIPVWVSAQTIGHVPQTPPPTRHRRAQSRAAASGAPPRAAGGNDCEGQPGGVPGRIRTWTSRETGRIGQDAQGFWPQLGNPSKEHRETRLRWVYSPGAQLPTAHWGGAQSPMPLVGSSLREKRAAEKGTPASSVCKPLQLRNQGLGSLQIGKP